MYRPEHQRKTTAETLYNYDRYIPLDEDKCDARDQNINA